jgi:hypothetical protein
VEKRSVLKYCTRKGVLDSERKEVKKRRKGKTDKKCEKRI